MFRNVDASREEGLEGYSYFNKHGDLEYVKLGIEGRTVEILGDEDEGAAIYKEDIPKLIKALEAAYSHLMCKTVTVK